MGHEVTTNLSDPPEIHLRTSKSQTLAISQSTASPERHSHAFCHPAADPTIGGMKPNLSRLISCVAALALTAASAIADEPKKPEPAPSKTAPSAPTLPAKPPATIVPTDYLVLPAVGQYGRLPLPRDALEAQIVAGTWKPPAA